MTNKLPDFVVQQPKTTAQTAPPNDAAQQSKDTDTSEFYAELKSLNQSVIGWMEENFEENPHVNFSPVFDDYKNHFKDLQEKHGITATSGGSAGSNQDAVDAPTVGHGAGFNGSAPVSVISKTLTNTASDKPSTGTPFRFGLTNSASSSPAPAAATPASQPHQEPKSFSFGLQPKDTSTANFGFPQSTAAKEQAPTLSTSSSTPSFSFGTAGSSSAPFSFGFKPPEKTAEAQEKDTNDGEEDEYVPPKPERVEQVEEGAFHSVRCKLFYKKEGTFVEKGVGMLFLKPLDGGHKIQLLIRADNATGKILLNVGLNSSIPCSKSGKNNLTMICMANPPLDPKAPSDEPAVLLLRVKTSEDADKLLEEIDKAKTRA